MFKKILLSNFLYLIIIFSAICVEVYFSYLFNQASLSLESNSGGFEEASLENQKLTSEITKYSSLSSIEERAAKLGFVKNGKVVYLTKGTTLAQKMK